MSGVMRLLSRTTWGFRRRWRRVGWQVAFARIVYAGIRTVAAAVRLASTLDELKMPAPFRLAKSRTLDGRRLVGITSRFRRAGHAVSETLYIDAVGSLPVEQIGSSSGVAVKSTFSRWNEKVSISPPASAIPVR